MDSYQELQREVEKVGLQDNEKINQLLKIYDNSPNQKQQEAVETQIRKICREKRKQPFESAPINAYTHQNSVFIGRDYHRNTSYYLPENSLTQHMLITAQSGAGKTNLINQIILQLDSPAWILDRKQDYRHLKEKTGNITVIPKEKLRLNPFKPPPGLPWREWKNKIIQVLTDSTHLLDASQNYITQNITPLYRKHLEDLNHPIEDPPTIHQLKKRIENQGYQPGTKKRQYQETVLNRLKPMTQGVSGQIFKDPHGFNLEKLAGQTVVFELDNLESYIQNFIMEFLIEWLYQYRLKHQGRTEQLKHSIIVDEGKSLFDKNKERKTANGIPHIDYLNAEIRFLGIGLIVADQEPLKLTDTLKANSNTKALLPTTDHKQLKDITESLGLNKYQLEKAQQLDTGEAIIKTGNNGPYRLQVKHVDLEEDITENEVLEDLHQSSFYKSFQEQKQDETENKTSSKDTENVEEPETKIKDLSEDAIQLLKQIMENPYRKITQHYKQISDVPKHGVEAKKQLIQKGFLEEAGSVNTGNGRQKLFKLTQKALNSLNTDIERNGRGSVKHRFWQHKISEKLENNGWTTGIEKLDADIFAKNQSREIAVEVALSQDQREIEHVEKHLGKGFDKVIIGTDKKKYKTGLDEKLEENGLNKKSVEIKLLKHLLQEKSL